MALRLSGTTGGNVRKDDAKLVVPTLSARPERNVVEGEFA